MGVKRNSLKMIKMAGKCEAGMADWFRKCPQSQLSRGRSFSRADIKNTLKYWPSVPRPPSGLQCHHPAVLGTGVGCGCWGRVGASIPEPLWEPGTGLSARERSPASSLSASCTVCSQVRALKCCCENSHGLLCGTDDELSAADKKLRLPTARGTPSQTAFPLSTFSCHFSFPSFKGTGQFTRHSQTCSLLGPSQPWEASRPGLLPFPGGGDWGEKVGDN